MQGQSRCKCGTSEQCDRIKDKRKRNKCALKHGHAKKKAEPGMVDVWIEYVVNCYTPVSRLFGGGVQGLMNPLETGTFMKTSSIYICWPLKANGCMAHAFAGNVSKFFGLHHRLKKSEHYSVLAECWTEVTAPAS